MEQRNGNIGASIPLTWGYLPFLMLGGIGMFLIMFAMGWLSTPLMSLVIGGGLAVEKIHHRGLRGGLAWAVVGILASVAAYFAVFPFHS